MMLKHDNDEKSGMRLDKWLWCARFFKTRGLAADAIKGGKITINDEKPKPSRTIQPGTRLIIKRSPYQFDITVTALSNSRKSAKDAALLFQETAESSKRREAISAQLKLNAMSLPTTPGRPTKRDRRQLLRFKTEP